MVINDICIYVCRPPWRQRFFFIIIIWINFISFPFPTFFPGLDMMVRSWFLGQRGDSSGRLSGGADWTGYGWLAEEDRNRRKTEEEKEKNGRKRGGSAERRGVRKAEQSSRSETHGFSDLFLGRSPPRCEPRRFSDHISHHICSSCIFLMGFSFHSLLEWVCSAILSFFFDFI